MFLRLPGSQRPNLLLSLRSAPPHTPLPPISLCGPFWTRECANLWASHKQSGPHRSGHMVPHPSNINTQPNRDPKARQRIGKQGLRVVHSAPAKDNPPLFITHVFGVRASPPATLLSAGASTHHTRATAPGSTPHLRRSPHSAATTHTEGHASIPSQVAALRVARRVHGAQSSVPTRIAPRDQSR